MEYEPVESPDFIQFCEDNHYGYCEGIDVASRMMMFRSFFQKKDGTWSYSNISTVHNPLFDGEWTTKPYAQALAEGTYEDPRDMTIRIQNEKWNAGDLKYVILDPVDGEETLVGSVYTDGKFIPQSEYDKLYGNKDNPGA